MTKQGYEEWKVEGGVDVQASAWFGQFTGYAILSLLFSYPLYLIGAALSKRLTFLPDTSLELAVLGSLAALLLLRMLLVARARRAQGVIGGQLSDAELRAAVARGEMTREQAVARSMGFNSREEAEAWVRAQRDEA